MVNGNCCLLCLEDTGDPIGQIDINAVESSKLGMREIIELYFKDEFSSALASSDKHMLCRSCWDAITAFHEFCLRVRAAHLSAVNMLQSASTLKVEIVEEPIKLEPEVEDVIVPSTTAAAGTTAKRGRGRPRKQPPVADANSSKTLLIEELQLPLRECSVQLERLKVPDFGIQFNELQLDDIKREEELDEELMNADFNDFDDSFEGNLSPLSIEEPIKVTPDKQKTSKSKPKPVAVTKTTKRKRSTSAKMVKKTKTTTTDSSDESKEPPKRKVKNPDVLNTAESNEFLSTRIRLVCAQCESDPQEVFADFQKLQRHYRAEHDCRGYITCCGKAYFKRSQLVDHVRMHENPEYFKCEKCGKVLGNRKSLDSHMLNHAIPKDGSFKCHICSKAFHRKPNLMNHLLKHVPEEQRRFHCPQCDKSFASNFLKLNHVNTVHLRLYTRICEICGKSLVGGDALKRHMDEHAGIEQPPAKCEICGAVVKSDLRLRRHMRRMHSEEEHTPQTCAICGKVSESARKHRIHMNYVHKERIHACTLCDKAFRKPKELKEHLVTHTGENLYTCTYCTQTFKSNANMYAHRKKKHYKEWLENRLQKERELLEKTAKYEAEKRAMTMPMSQQAVVGSVASTGVLSVASTLSDMPEQILENQMN